MNEDTWQRNLLRDVLNVREQIQAQINALESTMSRLERDADNCWEYPNAEERYSRFVDQMGYKESAIRALDPIMDIVDSLEREAKKLFPYDQYQYPVYTESEQSLQWIQRECQEYADDIITKICKRAIKTINSWGRDVIHGSGDYPAKFTVFDILSIELQSKYYCELGMFLQDAIEQALENEYDNLSEQEKFFVIHAEEADVEEEARDAIIKRINERFNEMWNEHYQLKKIQDFQERRTW